MHRWWEMCFCICLCIILTGSLSVVPHVVFNFPQLLVPSSSTYFQSPMNVLVNWFISSLAGDVKRKTNSICLLHYWNTSSVVAVESTQIHASKHVRPYTRNASIVFLCAGPLTSTFHFIASNRDITSVQYETPKKLLFQHWTFETLCILEAKSSFF